MEASSRGDGGTGERSPRDPNAASVKPAGGGALPFQQDSPSFVRQALGGETAGYHRRWMKRCLQQDRARAFGIGEARGGVYGSRRARQGQGGWHCPDPPSRASYRGLRTPPLRDTLSPCDSDTACAGILSPVFRGRRADNTCPSSRRADRRDGGCETRRSSAGDAGIPGAFRDPVIRGAGSLALSGER